MEELPIITKALDELFPFGFWYCPECKRCIEPSEVTFEEYHEYCGNIVEWVTFNPERRARARVIFYDIFQEGLAAAKQIYNESFNPGPAPGTEV